MSFIRTGQQGEYVEIPRGSMYYLYNNGDNIEGYTEEAFSSMIGELVYDLDIKDEKVEEISSAFEDYFGGWDGQHGGVIQPPERAEIFCQCLDKRFDSVELTDEIHEEVKNWLENQDFLRECDFCGEEFRPMIQFDSVKVCYKDKCQKEKDREFLEEIEEERGSDSDLYKVLKQGFERDYDETFK